MTDDQTTPPVGVNEKQIAEWEQQYEQAVLERECAVCEYEPVKMPSDPCFGCAHREEHPAFRPGALLVAIPALIAEVRDRGREIEGLRAERERLTSKSNRLVSKLERLQGGKVVLDDEPAALQAAQEEQS